MQTGFIKLTALLAAAATLAAPGGAMAQDSEMARMRRQMVEMQRQMEAMQRRLVEMESAQSTATEAVRDARREAAAAQEMARGDAPVPAGRLANSFAVPGTNGRARLRVSGQVKANAAIDLQGRNNSDSITPSSVPLDNAGSARQDGNLQASARRSRIRLESEIETGWTGDWRLSSQVLEFDFAGSGASGASVGTSNAYNPRLRLAFATLGPVMVGQNASLYQFPSAAMPERLDDGTFLGTSGVRQLGLRYSVRLAEGLRAAAALESPYSDFTSTAQANINNDNGSGSLTGSNNVPDLLGGLDYTSRWGGLALRGVARQIKMDNQSSGTAGDRFTETAFGFGTGFGAWINAGQIASVFEGGRLFGIVNYGQGIGRYLDGTANGVGATTDFGLGGVRAAESRLDPVTLFTGMVGYRHAWTETLRSSVAFAYADYDYQSYAARFSSTAGSLNRRVQQASVNLIWSPRPWFDVGVEYIYVSRDVLNATAAGAASGEASRLQASMIARF